MWIMRSRAGGFIRQLGKEVLDFHKECIWNGLRRSLREITLVSLDKWKCSCARQQTLTSSCRPFRDQTAGLFLSILRNMRTCLFPSDRLHGSIAQKPYNRLPIIISSISPDSPKSITLGNRCSCESFMGYHGQRDGVYLAEKSLKVCQ